MIMAEIVLDFARVVVKLARPFPWPGASGDMRQVTELVIREPDGKMYAELGEPRVLVYKENGGYYVDNASVINAYMQRMIKHDLGADVLNFLTLEDAKAVKEAVLSFFMAAEAKLLARRSMASSSASGS
jgi:hypothetical protein